MAKKRQSKAGLKPYEVTARFLMQASTRPYATAPGAPLTRRLRIFTLDPSVSRRTGGIATVDVPFEDLDPGPAGALFEIDPKGAPKPLKAELLNLEDRYMLLQDGLAPTPANGQFHLQMVYAVCSLTYEAFRRALGRDIAWACGVPAKKTGQLRLRVRPFAFREDNAYYAREDNGLSFGYFNATQRPAGFTVPHGLAFASLSHDIIAHETTHALLDGLRSQFYDPVQTDVLGFHEGFADIVAYFLHFTYPDVVEHAIRESSGVISQATLLTNLAAEFGYADSAQGKALAMRSAVDVRGLAAFDSDAFAPGKEGPKVYRKNLEAHDMGSVLVSAVFEAFVTIFRRKTERLLGIAGIPANEVGTRPLGGQLVRALAEQASEIAGQFLNVCIRAIDYCPPVDMQLSEYLRALITADAEMVPNDKWGYREALMRSFRRRNIFPDHVGFMTEDALLWDKPDQKIVIEELAFRNLRFDGDPGRAPDKHELQRQGDALGAFISSPRNAASFHLIAPGAPLPKGVQYAAPPSVESLRCARRVAPNGTIMFDLVAEVLQSGTIQREGTLMEFTGGCTIVIDPYGEVRYVIHKRLNSVERQDCQFQAVQGPLKAFWKKEGKKMKPRPGTLKILHAATHGRQT